MSKNKNMQKNGIDSENSTLFKNSGRKKAGEDGAPPKKQKSKAKIIIAVFIAAAVLLVGVPWVIVTVTDSPNEAIINNGRARLPFEKLLEHTSATEISTELFSMKNPDINDHAAVTELIGRLHPEEELGGYSVEVHSSEKPYTVTLKFELAHKVGEDAEDDWDVTVIKYSCAILSLIDNIAQVNWEYPVNSTETGGAYFTRADAEKLMNLNVPVSRFAESETAVQLLLNQLGIDLYN